MNKKLFISQPMKGLSSDKIKKERNRIYENLQILYPNLELIDSYIEGVDPEVSPLWYLGESIKKLSEADIAVFCKGWEDARGCRIERECAREYHIESIEE